MSASGRLSSADDVFARDECIVPDSGFDLQVVPNPGLLNNRSSLVAKCLAAVATAVGRETRKPLFGPWRARSRLLGDQSLNAHGAWFLFGAERFGFHSKCRLIGGIPLRRIDLLTFSLICE
jgi:hypothetical protein